tara:strand:+ start:1208 stop:1312 length:105 start_codon:yes stop_codon:yes gene_type:complete
MIKDIAYTVLPLIIMVSILVGVFALNAMRYGGMF